MRSGLAVLGGAAVLALAAPAGALAAPANILGGDPDPNSANPDVFLPTTYSHEAGTIASLTYVAGGAHDADAIANGPDGQPLFRTELTRSAVQVPGTQYLTLGSYPFVCTVHSGMTGTLNVDSGVPKPRPTVALKLKTKSIDRAVGSGVKVRVTITGGSGEPAEVSVKLGKKTLGSATTTASRTVKVRLGKKARAALEKKGSAKLTASAEIPFGAPVTGSGKLR